MASRVFITATDTDAGKTWVTASAIRTLVQRNISAKAIKPIACGLDPAGNNADIQTLLTAQRLKHASHINCYRFTLPAAPSQAAVAEGREIDANKLVYWCRKQASDVETCLIEGVGGLMTPISNTWLVSDWIAAMPEYDVWLVVGCKLGAINQALLTLDKLKQMNRTPARTIFNASTAEQNAWIAPVMDAVMPFIGDGCLTSGVRYLEPVTL
ncbi:MAG: dethiobiotin synthase [Mariprofundus sp.]